MVPALAMGVGAGLLTAGGLSTLTAATMLARRAVRVDSDRADDAEILTVGSGTVTLRDVGPAAAPGKYGLWLDAGAGHARVGEIVDRAAATGRIARRPGTVTRRLLGVDAGQVHPGPARWDAGYFTGDPMTAFGLPFENVMIEGSGLQLPAWYVPAEDGGRRWAVLVHGRGATRAECLRALPLLQRLGIPALVISYRNDQDVDQPGDPGQHHLGDSEWLDVEAAVLHALNADAYDVVLIGWSMGGAIALQYADRSWTAGRLAAMVLDAPVIDWRDVFDHHARLNRVPRRVGRLAQWLLGHDLARRVIGLSRALPLDRLDWATRSSDLRVPTLILHSDDDDWVPSGPSRLLAARRPDLVHLVSSRGAGHTAEWNVDPVAWETEVARFLLAV